jgi:SAM-dependent methyltransferase
MDRTEYKRTALEGWQRMASGWEERREDRERVLRRVTEWLVQAVDPKPGGTVLELAAGPGDVGLTAAPVLGPEGRLISSDFSPAMVDVSRRRAEELGLRNVEHLVLDAEDVALEDDSVDGVLCRFGYMLLPDPERALAETRRVLRPGGRLALAVWSTGERNPWVTVAGRILVELGLAPPPEPGAPGMFVFADEGRLRGLLEGAGFTVERVEDVPVLHTYDDVDDYITASNQTSGMFSRIWQETSDDEREAITTRLAEDFAPFAVDGGYALPGVTVCASAT